MPICPHCIAIASTSVFALGGAMSLGVIGHSILGNLNAIKRALRGERIDYAMSHYDAEGRFQSPSALAVSERSTIAE